MQTYMTGGALEVLLVDAEGIRHTNLLGKPIPSKIGCAQILPTTVST